MNSLRLLTRLAALSAWSAAVCLALGLLGARAAVVGDDDHRHPRLLRLWARGAGRIVGVRVVASGTPPQGEFLLVANHLSYLDVVVLGGLVEASFVARADVASWPIIGTLSRWFRTLFIDRTRKRDLLRVLPLLERALRTGRSVVLFPEGTTSDGSSVLPFKSPLFEAALRADRPTHVATLRYATPAGSPDATRAVCWWGDMTFGRHLIALLRLPGVTAEVEFSPAPLVAVDRKHLARSAYREARRCHRPGSRGEPPCLATSL